MNTGAAVIGMTVHRFRRLYVGFSAYLLLLAILGHLPVQWLHPAVAMILCMPFAWGLLTTLFGFVNVEADIASTQSAYSPWLLRLPLRTWALAFWPIAAAATWASASWVIFAAFYLQPRGIAAPIWWPAAMFTALVLNLQAIMWAPVRHGALRLVIALAMPLSISLFGLFAATYGWTADRIAQIYVLVAIGSAFAAWVGLTRARTSPSARFHIGHEHRESEQSARIRHPRRPFKSPQSAQFWLEWRRQGRLLPLMTAFGLGAMSIPLFLSRDMSFLPGSDTIKVNIWMSTALPILPWIPMLLATAIGMGARPSDVRGTDGVYHLYHATRPLGATDLYRAKMRSITAGILLTSAMTVATMLIWLWLPAETVNGVRRPYARMVFEGFHAPEFALVAGIVVVLTSWAWRNQAVGAFVDYLPSRRLAGAYPVAVILIGATIFALCSSNGEALQAPSGVLIATVIVSVVLAAKIGVAIAFALRLHSLRAAIARDLIKALVGWALVAAAFSIAFGVIVYELPYSALPGYFHHPVPELLAILLVPLARPFAARIALELGRHR